MKKYEVVLFLNGEVQGISVSAEWFELSGGVLCFKCFDETLDFDYEVACFSSWIYVVQK